MFNSETEDAQKEWLAVTRAHAEGLVLGTRVECRYGRSVNYYWGKINWINEDGTFDILYEDGDQEFGVLRRLFRVDPGLRVGDIVEARSDEDNRFIEVSGVPSSACVVVVLWLLCCARGRGAQSVALLVLSSSRLPPCRRRDSRCSSVFLCSQGVIAKVRPNDVYDIAFDDNDVRQNVRRVLIRRRDPAL